MRAKTPPLSEVTEMHNYYRNGHSLIETARHFHVNKSSMWRWFNQLGFPTRSVTHTRLLRRDMQMIRSMYTEWRNGTRMTDIAQRYHYQPRSIYKLFRKAGITKRDKTNRDYEVAA